MLLLGVIILELVLASTFIPRVHALSVYAACQTTLGKAVDPVLGCPKGTIFVSQKDPRAKFSSVQAAVLSLPLDDSPQWILVDAGIYKEATLCSPPIVADYWVDEHNLVTIYNTTFINQTTQNASILDNADSQVLTVAPNKYSVWTGQGYYGATPQPIPDEWGCKDFRSYNINWENRAGNASIGPALAVGVGFANASFYGSSFKSWQDTVFVGKNASVIFKKSLVLGQTDYVYGFGTAYFLESVLGSRGAGCLTAFKGTPNYTNTYGVYFENSRVVHSPELSAAQAANFTGTQCLGRPWNNATTAVYMNTYMDSSVLPAGFTIWSPTDPRNGTLLFYGEHGSYGPGWNRSARATFDHILTAPQAQRFSLQNVFGKNPAWLDDLY
ncbi:pectin lyase-like protein [Punctularia strigosozonata HHB-11173 SS5]|uniref:pectin lyase-like protein n=1 Tax=Punctularia strigosozonata (strain HHB-11173) TaxID=741275 RepID=UPI00044185B1|nr:pectin lyase-like protein [Punctularia strigosozonata HHB-11173 SS5]EIN07059.1 pectin lyase-like protein [Punctularia strigosozonata HHB-11173 SS5]